jgi:rhodanese-related sulfurtransferase
MSRQGHSVTPAVAAQHLRSDTAIIVDIREAHEYARVRIEGSLSRPLSTLSSAALKAEITDGKTVILCCQSGMRTAAHRHRLKGDGPLELMVLEGGIDAWTNAGLPLTRSANQPLDIMRQVHISAGAMVLSGLILGLRVHPGWFALSALAGAGLAFAGMTGFCGMARLLAVAPWNRRSA